MNKRHRLPRSRSDAPSLTVESGARVADISEPARSSASRWLLFSKFALSLLLITYLAATVEWRNVWASMRNVSAIWLLVSVLFIPAAILLQALRYHYLINNLVPFPAILRLVVFQGSISTFVANAAGSLSYMAILIKVYNVPAELAIQSTIIARMADMLSALIVMPILVTVVWRELGPTQWLVVMAMLLAMIGLLLVVALIGLASRLRLASGPAAGQAKGRWRALWQRTLKFGVKVMRFDAQYVKSKTSILLMYCLALQIITAVAMYCSARAFDLGIGFFEAAFAGTVSAFLASVPLTVFGGLGVYELSTVGLLQIFAVPVEAGAAMILVVRALFFIIMAMAFVIVRPPHNELHSRTEA